MIKRSRPHIRGLFRLLLVLAAIFCAESVIRPNIAIIAEHQCANRAAAIINSAVLAELDSAGELIESAVKINYSADGKITSVVSNGYFFSITKELISKKLIEEFSDTGIIRTKVRLGSLFGIPTLSAGAEIPVYIYAAGTPETDISGRLITTGINQSIYRVTLTYRAEVTALIAFHPARVAVEDEIVLAEIVFGGEVPQVVINR